VSHEVNESAGAGARAWFTGWGSSTVAVAITEVHEIFLVSMLSLFVISLVLLSLESGVSLEASDVSLMSLVFFLEVIMIVFSIEENDEVFFSRFDGSTGGFDGTSGVGGTLRHVLKGFSRVRSSLGFFAAVGGSDRHVLEGGSRLGSTDRFLRTSGVGGSNRVRHVHERFSRVGSSLGFVAAVGGSDRHVHEGFSRLGSTDGFLRTSRVGGSNRVRHVHEGVGVGRGTGGLLGTS